jgi:hypothetical protein
MKENEMGETYSRRGAREERIQNLVEKPAMGERVWNKRGKLEGNINPLTLELNPSKQRSLTRFLLGILLLEPCILLIYTWKTNKYTNYSFSLLIMYGSSYMFRHYIAIFRELS